MHDPPDARAARGVDEALGIVDGDRVSETSVRRAHPVRVVKGVGALQRGEEGIDVLEVQRIGRNPWRERILGLGMVGERTHAPTSLEQLRGNEPTAVAEGAGHDVNRGHSPVLGQSMVVIAVDMFDN